MTIRYLYILFTFLFSCNLLAQGSGQANVFMDSTTFLIGDQVKVQLVVNIPLGNTLVYPVIGDLLTAEKLELIGQDPTETVNGDVNATYKTNLIITAWEAGNYFFPALSFSYKKNGQVVEFKSAQVALTVKAPEITGDSTYVADIKSILAEEPNFWDKLYAFFTHPVTVSVIILLLAFLAFYAYMRYKNRPKPTAAATPEELALQRLEQLKTNNPLEQNNFKEFHTQISFILRAYINGRFRVSALEQPLSYFMPQVQTHELMTKDLFGELHTVLEHADLIKFAKASPLDIANKKALDFSFELINTIQEKLKEYEHLEPEIHSNFETSSFETKATTESAIAVTPVEQAVKDEKKENSKKAMLFGGVLCSVGLIITAVSYSLASEGGTYIAATGLMVFGAIQFFKGLYNWLS